MKMYYVISLGPTDCHVLNLQPYTHDEAIRAIAWQVKGGFQKEDFRITTYSKALYCFIDPQTGEVFCPRRAPYTKEAWSNFIEGLKE